MERDAEGGFGAVVCGVVRLCHTTLHRNTHTHAAVDPKVQEKRTRDHTSNMGASVSHAAEMDAPTHVPMPEDEPEATSKTTQLPQPVKYEDLQREVLSTCCE